MPSSISGTTTDDWAEVTSFSGGDDGVKAFGSLKNNGLEGLLVRLNLIDYDGNVETYEPPAVGAGEFFPFTTVASSYGMVARPPYEKIVVQTKSSSAGKSTGYNLLTTQF